MPQIPNVLPHLAALGLIEEFGIKLANLGMQLPRKILIAELGIELANLGMRLSRKITRT